MLGLRFFAKAFSSCGERGPLFIAVCGPLTIAASLVAEHRLQTLRLSSCGSWAQLLRGMWDLRRPGLKPVSPALAGRFSTTAPPGKPKFFYFYFFTLQCSCIVLLTSVSISWPIFWTLYQVITYLCFIRVFFWGVILFFHLEHIPFFFTFLDFLCWFLCIV